MTKCLEWELDINIMYCEAIYTYAVQLYANHIGFHNDNKGIIIIRTEYGSSTQYRLLSKQMSLPNGVR